MAFLQESKEMNDIQGGCLCGTVRYHTTQPALMTAACHCRDCQKQSGSAFSVNVLVPLAGLDVGGASLAAFETQGSSGLTVKRHFCGQCGSPVYSELQAMPGVAAIKAGTLDDASWAKPSMQLWCASAQPWVPRMADATSFDTNPPAP